MLDILGTDNTGVDDVVVDSKNFVFIRPFDTTSYNLNIQTTKQKIGSVMIFNK